MPASKRDKKVHGRRYSVAQKLAIVALKDGGMSTRQIAAGTDNVSQRTVARILQDDELAELRSTEVAQIKKGLINLGYKRSFESMKSISIDKLSKASAVQSAITSKICMEISRLMEDKSTSNISHRGLLESIAGDRERISEAIQRLSAETESASIDAVADHLPHNEGSNGSNG